MIATWVPVAFQHGGVELQELRICGRLTRPGLTSSRTGPAWSSPASLRRRSIVACRRCVATTASRTSTGGSRRTPPSTCADQRVHPSTQQGMDRGELASFLYTAERTSPMHAALAVLLGLNGLRVSEARGADLEDLGSERRHRTVQDRRQGQQAIRRPTPATRGTDHRPGDRRTQSRADSDPPRRATARHPNGLPLGAISRQTGRTGSRPPAHAAHRVHHGRPRRRRPATRRPSRGPPCRPTHHHRVRPATSELRPTQRRTQSSRSSRTAEPSGVGERGLPTPTREQFAATALDQPRPTTAAPAIKDVDVVDR